MRREAARPELGTPVSTELLASLDAVTTARRDRIAAASRRHPGAVRRHPARERTRADRQRRGPDRPQRRPTSLLVVGLATVVGLSLALLFSLSGPWRGPLMVSGQPDDAIIRDLETGFFDASR